MKVGSKSLDSGLKVTGNPNRNSEIDWWSFPFDQNTTSGKKNKNNEKKSKKIKKWTQNFCNCIY